MKAVIMAGGEGTRLRPLTCSIPKPMVPVANRPVMEHIINLLKKHGITEIAVTLFYLPDVIMDYFENGERFGVNLHYFIEKNPLGTGGSVLNARDFLDDSFIVISGDAITDINLEKALEYHRSKNSKATLVLKKEPIPLEFGIVITNSEGSITKFLEKPSWGEVFSDTINTGIYILEPEVLNYYKPGDNFDFSKDLFPKLLNDHIPMYGYVATEYWCDIGDLNSYKQTHFDILDHKLSVNVEASSQNNVWIGDGSVISGDVKINPPVLIGDHCSIEKGATIDAYSIIGNNCTIGEGTTVKKSILWNNCRLGKNDQCRGTILCSKNTLKDNVNLFEDSVIGTGCLVNDRATVNPKIKIWPGKKIDENTIINMNLIWGTAYSKAIFGNRGISGEINTTITPEFASSLASAFTMVIGKKAPIIVSSDNNNTSKIIKQSILAGVMSSGANAISIDNVILPISRFAVQFYKAAGGLHISTDFSDHGKIHIEFINDHGGNMDRKNEKKVENLFFREDFERCSNDTAGSISHVDNFASFYIQHNAPFIRNTNKIKEKKPKVILASISDQTTLLAASFMEFIGCGVEINYETKNYKNRDTFVSYFSKTVPAKKMDLGVIFSENGENIILIDPSGQVIDGEKYLLLSSLITLKSEFIKKIIAPYTAPMVIEEMAKKYGAEVVRSKSGISDMTNNLLSDSESQIQYFLNFDGILAAAKIIDFLVGTSTALNQLISEIPDFYVKKSQMPCDFKDRGKIIHQLIEDYSGQDIELFEGIKVNTQKGWTHILPDNEKPVFNILTEGLSEEYAQELTDTITAKLSKMLKVKTI